MFHKSLTNLLKLIDKKGLMNVGGKKMTVFKFARLNNKKVLKISAKNVFGKKYPLKQSMNVSLYNKIIK